MPFHKRYFHNWANMLPNKYTPSWRKYQNKPETCLRAVYCRRFAFLNETGYFRLIECLRTAFYLQSSPSVKSILYQTYLRRVALLVNITQKGGITCIYHSEGWHYLYISLRRVASLVYITQKGGITCIYQIIQGFL